MYRYSNGQISLADFKQPVGMNLKESIYRETGSLDAALQGAFKTHQNWINIWGDEDTYCVSII